MILKAAWVMYCAILYGTTHGITLLLHFGLGPPSAHTHYTGLPLYAVGHLSCTWWLLQTMSHALIGLGPRPASQLGVHAAYSFH